MGCSFQTCWKDENHNPKAQAFHYCSVDSLEENALILLGSTYTGWDKSRFIAVTWNRVIIVLFINYCIIFHMNSSKPTFAPPLISAEGQRNTNWWAEVMLFW